MSLWGAPRVDQVSSRVTDRLPELAAGFRAGGRGRTSSKCISLAGAVASVKKEPADEAARAHG